MYCSQCESSCGWSLVRPSSESNDPLQARVIAERSSSRSQKTDLVTISERGVEAAAKYVCLFTCKNSLCSLFTQIHSRLQAESYTPRTWRTHPLHLLSPDPYLPADPATKACLDWLFLISSLNFSFWSEREGHQDRYGVEWWAGWGSEEKVVHTGYWSLVAAVNRGKSLLSDFV